MPEITVIIPTICDERRGETIWRAIESAGSRAGASTRVLVVINGKRFSEKLLSQLRATEGVDCATIEAGSLPLAIQHGRGLVATDFFAFLDDDDEFLENGLRMRLDVLQRDPRAAFVISNGFVTSPQGDLLIVPLKSDAIEADPFGTLITYNWMATSASGLYRTSAVSSEDLAAMPAYLEWTYVGFRLAGRPFRFLESPTYRRYDLPGSLSKSHAYRVGLIAALHRILTLNVPRHAREGLRRRLGAVHHVLSLSYLQEGSLSLAWKHHGLSLTYPGGWRYAPYTRKLFRPPSPLPT